MNVSEGGKDAKVKSSFDFYDELKVYLKKKIHRRKVRITLQQSKYEIREDTKL